jgi:diguanylate cyclase
MASTQKKAQLSPDISRNAFGLLARLNIEPTPIHFELVYEIVSGNNPELRRRFVELGKTVTPAAMETLARTFLPHHFGESVYDRSAGAIHQELGEFQALMVGSQTSLLAFRDTLSGAAERLGRLPPEAASVLREEIDQMVLATTEQNMRTGQVLERVGKQLAAVDSLNSEIDAANRAKFIHQTTGLGNRRAFNRALAEIYRAGARPKDCTLVLGRIANFSLFNTPNLLKVKEMVLAGFGTFAAKTLTPEDAGFWLEHPEMAFIIHSLREDEVRDVTDRLRDNLLVQFRAVGMAPQVLEKLHICFGAANTLSATDAGGLLVHVENALNAGMATGESRTMFHVLLEPSGPDKGKEYALYGRREFKM